MFYIKKITQGIIFFGICISPCFLYAANIYTEVVPQESQGIYHVSVFVDTEEVANALQGELVIPEFMALEKISEGNSVLHFWIEKPRLEGNSVFFGGITPGGFSGERKLVFSIIAKQVRQGTGDISFRNVTLLGNNETGTRLVVKTTQTRIGGNEVSQVESVPFVDSIPPETFTPEIGRDESLFDGQWFIAFSTTDKDSGVKEYQVRESRFSWFTFGKKWIPAESPYVLQDQTLKSVIFVKALDRNLNEQISISYPDRVWYQNISYWLIIGGVLFLFYFIWKRKRLAL
ncbi:MAG: hypothetical protein RJA61_661 [Candidatus Parcubacteria bacterium]|jgi:hypothetical protein